MFLRNLVNDKGTSEHALDHFNIALMERLGDQVRKSQMINTSDKSDKDVSLETVVKSIKMDLI